MTDNAAFYRWSKFQNGIGSVALVSLEVEQSPSGTNQILEHYNGEEFTSQGNLEEVSQNGYDSWKIAARHGLEYGFSLIDTYWTVHIHKIRGLSTDANPTIVGYTVLRAFFDKINYQLTDPQIEKLENFVMSSWTKPYKELIPNFFTLTFTAFGG